MALHKIISGRLSTRSTRSRQEIAHRTIVPNSTARRADAPVIECLSYRAMGACTRRLYLSHDGQHIGREGVRRLPVCRHALRLRIGEIGPVPKNGALRLFLSQSCPGPVCDQCSLFLGLCGVDVQHERVGVRAQLGDDERLSLS